MRRARRPLGSRRGRFAPSGPCRAHAPSAGRGRRRRDRGQRARRRAGRSRTGARARPRRARGPPHRALRYPSGPSPRRSAGRRRAFAVAAGRGPRAQRSARAPRAGPGTGTSSVRRPACARSSPSRASARAGGRGSRGSCGCRRGRARWTDRPGRRTARTRGDRFGSCGACAVRRPSRAKGGGETRPANPSCHRELDLPLEVAPLTRAAADGAVLQHALGDEGGPALRARLVDRAAPDYELAVRVRRAAEEGPALARAPLDQLARAARLGARDAERHRLGRLALRIAGARDELAEAPVLDDHRLAAGRAILVRRLVLGATAAVEVARVAAVGIRRARQELAESSPLLQEFAAALGAGLAGGRPDLLALHLALGAGEVALERLVELADRVDPLALTFLDLVEVVFHLRRELDVHDVLEVRDQLVGHRHAELGRRERPPLAVHVAAVVDDRAEDRRVRGRPSDAELFERLDQRGLREAGRRLGEVLLGLQRQQALHLALLERRNLPFRLLLGLSVLFVAALLVDRREALELERGSLRPEHALTGLDVGADGVVDGRHHLAGQEALPDEPVERHLVLGEELRDGPGLVAELGGSNRLVRLLGAPPRAVGRRSLRYVFVADAGDDPAAGRGLRLPRDPDRVGSHVRDQALGALGPEVDSLVELLGDRHGLARREAKLLAGLLLQGGGDERGRRIAPPLAARDGLDDEPSALERSHEGAGGLLVAERGLLARDFL